MTQPPEFRVTGDGRLEELTQDGWVLVTRRPPSPEDREEVETERRGSPEKVVVASRARYKRGPTADYVHGRDRLLYTHYECRCDKCRKLHAAYQRAWRKRARR